MVTTMTIKEETAVLMTPPLKERLGVANSLLTES